MAIGRSVSLYSLQEPYYLGQLDLEGCVERVKNGVGADGIEVLVDQMPYLSLRSEDRTMSEEDVSRFRDLMQKYETVPTAYDTTFFTTWYANRLMTVKEAVYWTRKDLRNAARMGFSVYRTGIIRKEDIEILSACFADAEDLGVQIATEIHAPRGIHTWWTQEFLEEILKKNTKAAGFVLDFGIFTKGMSLADKNLYLRQGADEKILEQIDEAYRAGKPLTRREVEKMGGKDPEQAAAARLEGAIRDDPEWIREILPYTRHCHGKFYEMTEGCEEPAVDYEGPVRVLKEENWNGWISSEYEGQRQYFDLGCEISMDAVEQLRRHHVMLKKLIGE